MFGTFEANEQLPPGKSTSRSSRAIILTATLVVAVISIGAYCRGVNGGFQTTPTALALESPIDFLSDEDIQVSPPLTAKKAAAAEEKAAKKAAAAEEKAAKKAAKKVAKAAAKEAAAAEKKAAEEKAAEEKLPDCLATSTPSDDGTAGNFYCINGGNIGGITGACTCSCNAGYSGDSCETAISCAEVGYAGVDGSCTCDSGFFGGKVKYFGGAPSGCAGEAFLRVRFPQIDFTTCCGDKDLKRDFLEKCTTAYAVKNMKCTNVIEGSAIVEFQGSAGAIDELEKTAADGYLAFGSFDFSDARMTEMGETQKNGNCCELHDLAQTDMAAAAAETAAGGRKVGKGSCESKEWCPLGYQTDGWCNSGKKCCFNAPDPTKCIISKTPGEPGDDDFEWEYYAVDEVVDEPDSDLLVVIEEMETSIQEVVETYFEYEYQYEYEYEGALVVGGEAIGKFWAKELACPDHFIRDCSGFCAPAYWVGNGLCDDGGVNTGKVGATGFPFVSDGDVTFMPDTNPVNLNLPSNERDSEDRVAYNFDCAQFWNDGGDCTSKNGSVQDSFDTRYAAYMTLSLEVGGRQLGVPTLAIAAMAVVGIAGVAMRR